MIVRAITQAELDRFARLSGPPARIEAFKEALVDMWAEGKSFPAWCFLAEEGGHPTARVGYWVPTPGLQEIRMFGLELPWDTNYLAVGTLLLQESLRQMAEQGARRLERRLSGRWDFTAEQRVLYRRIGMRLIQEKIGFVWPGAQTLLMIPDRLVYHPVDQVGEASFLDVLRRVRHGSLDRIDQLDQQERGDQAAARALLNDLKGFEHQPDWWQIASSLDGAHVGLVAPVLLALDEGSIGYLGVVPEQRGVRYGFDLLVKGTAILQANGVPSIYCDTDRDNTPMIQAFERAGYRHEPDDRMWVYQIELDALDGPGERLSGGS